MHDRLQVRELRGARCLAGGRRQGQAARAACGAHHGVAVLQFQGFCLGRGQPEPARHVVGHMVAADGQHPRVGDLGLRVDHVVGLAAAEVDQQRALPLLVGRQRRLRRAQPAEQRFGHLQFQRLDHPHQIHHPRMDAVHDQHLRRQTLAHEPHRRHARQPVHGELPENAVEDFAIRRQRRFLGHFQHVVGVFLRDFAVHGDFRAAGLGLDLRPGQRQIDFVDLQVRGFLGLPQRGFHAPADAVEMENLPLAHAAAGGIAHRGDHQRAVLAGLAHENAHPACADFQRDDRFDVHPARLPFRPRPVRAPRPPPPTAPRSCGPPSDRTWPGSVPGGAPP